MIYRNILGHCFCCHDLPFGRLSRNELPRNSCFEDLRLSFWALVSCISHIIATQTLLHEKSLPQSSRSWALATVTWTICRLRLKVTSFTLTLASSSEKLPGFSQREVWDRERSSFGTWASKIMVVIQKCVEEGPQRPFAMCWNRAPSIFLSKIDCQESKVSKLVQRSAFGVVLRRGFIKPPPQEKRRSACLSLWGSQAFCSTIAVAATGCKRRGASAWSMKHRGVSGFGKVWHAWPSYANGGALVLFFSLAKVYL